MNHLDPTSPLPAKPPKSTGVKVAIGCGIGCLGLIVIAVIALFLSWGWLMKYVGKFEAEFQDMGLKLQTKAQLVTVDTPPQEPAYFVGQIVKINADTNVEIGIIAQVAEIHGVIDAPVHFRGQVIQIKPGGHLKQGLDVKCQMIDSQGGRIDGEITGSYQVGPRTPVQSAPANVPGDPAPAPALAP